MSGVSFQDEMARNKRSSLILVILVSAILFVLVYIFVYILAPAFIFFSLPVALLLIILYSYWSYNYGDGIVISATKSFPAEGREYQYLRDSVEGLSLAAGIPTPKIYVIKSDEINAFATGKDPEHASISVTSRLLKETNRSELEGVIAHEISHIKNRDILFMTLIAVLVGLAAILSHIILRSFMFGGIRSGRGDKKERGGGMEVIILLIGFILAIFAPIVVRLVQFAVSRKREYLADASSAELTRYPEGLASALVKIGNVNKGDMDVSEAVSHLFFVDPKRSPLDALYDTHPPIQDRIKRLRAM